ncbi:hypothetical protein J7E38_10115 [Bacillus sp. ISL-35]|uniref:CBO0543 family protein n=1 Tax=Bacillus sp. ISL-35 TaxID=2819122 RepID=UPI001BEBD380|nr:CBO0543 family protein [Bacillus sp. ISL-35]MBT2679358.1 hypothetical protein [Bacillus sp. ISL-35]MBT2703257.1 hypothetical protein [Chryseobacterium sp. ISL-80]
MKDRTILNILTLFGIFGSIFFLSRKKYKFKDWVLIYFIKTLVSTIFDGPVIKRKYVKYPHRYYPKFFDSNIVFLYVLFPLTCVMYNQFTNKMNTLKSILSVPLFSGPMTILEHWLEKNTGLVEYRKGWNSYITFMVLSFTFLLVKGSIKGILILDHKFNNFAKNENDDVLSERT